MSFQRIFCDWPDPESQFLSEGRVSWKVIRSPSTLVHQCRGHSDLLLVFWLLVFFLRTHVDTMAFPSAMEVFDMKDVFFFLLGNNIDTCHREVLASSPFSSTMVPKTSLMVLVFFLVGGGCLLPTRYVSRENVNGLILPRVLSFLFCWSVPSETLGIDLLDAWRWL